MYGTLAGALEARHVQFDRDRYSASAEGMIDGSGKTIRISAINIHYKLTIAKGDRDKAQRALEAHPAGCPAHQSVQGAIAVTWDAQIEEM